MFSTLRQNSQLYVLDKKNLTLNNGTVSTISAPTFRNQYNYMDTTVDISVLVNGETMKFEKIPSNFNIATIGSMVISDDKQSVITEIENMVRNSKSMLDSIDYHKEVISKCDNILRDINPQFAKEKQQEEDINNLKTELADIKDMLSKALNKTN